jgi:hypothetical protein
MAKRSKPLPQLTRERLRAGEALHRLGLIEETLARDYLKLGPEEIRALEALGKICMWKVNKVLPELKAIEHSGNIAITSFTLKANP